MIDKKNTIFKSGHPWRQLILLLGILIAIYLLLVHSQLHEYAFDDAYIHFRIADHFARYGEPYFNRNEAVLASTSIGWTIILGILQWWSQQFSYNINLPVITSSINALASLLGAFVYTYLLTRLVQKAVSVIVMVVFFLSYLGIILPVSVGLMETPVAMLLAGIAFILLLDKNRWCITILAILPFFRPEFVVVAALGVLYIIVTRWFKYIDVIIYYLIGTLPFIIFDFYFFRTIIPNTLYVKSVVYSLTYPATIKYFLSNIWTDLDLVSFLIPISSTTRMVYIGYVIWVISSIIIIYLYKTGYHFFIKREIKHTELLGLLFLVWSLTIIFGYIYRRVLIFSWYNALYLVPLLIFIGKTFVDSQSRKLSLLLGIMLLPLLFGQSSRILQLSMGAFIDRSFLPEFLSSARVRNYIQIGKDLYRQFPDARIMAAEIGGLGYGFEGYIYDGVGLVSPDALKYHPLGENVFGEIPSGFLEEKKPDVIVGYDIFLQDINNSNILDEYDLYTYPLLLEDDLQKVDNPEQLFNSNALNVYLRNDLLP